jgi:hypothetical protein
MASDLYIINVNEGEESFEDSLKKHELNLSKRIVEAICWAVANGKSYVEVAKIVTSSHIVTLKSTEKFFLETLKINMVTLIQYEEFELCAEAKKAIDILEEKKFQKFLENSNTDTTFTSDNEQDL